MPRCPGAPALRPGAPDPRCPDLPAGHPLKTPPGGEYSRRGFLGEAFKLVAQKAGALIADRVAPRRHFRPPGALAEPAFLAACTRCGYCMEACPVHAVVPAPVSAGLAASTPIIEPLQQPCVACEGMFCASVCPTGALVMPADGWATERLGELVLDTERCIAFQGIECGVCARACPVGPEALALDHEGRPVILSGCVGCGVCVKVCVTSPSSLSLNLAESF